MFSGSQGHLSEDIQNGEKWPPWNLIFLFLKISLTVYVQSFGHNNFLNFNNLKKSNIIFKISDVFLEHTFERLVTNHISFATSGIALCWKLFKVINLTLTLSETICASLLAEFRFDSFSRDYFTVKNILERWSEALIVFISRNFWNDN